MAKFGVKPSALPDLFGLVGDVADNIPGATAVANMFDVFWRGLPYRYFVFLDNAPTQAKGLRGCSRRSNQKSDWKLYHFPCRVLSDGVCVMDNGSWLATSWPVFNGWNYVVVSWFV